MRIRYHSKKQVMHIVSATCNKFQPKIFMVGQKNLEVIKHFLSKYLGYTVMAIGAVFTTHHIHIASSYLITITIMNKCLGSCNYVVLYIKLASALLTLAKPCM